MRAGLLAVPLLWALSACAPPTMYHWNGYDSALYAHYQAPAEREDFVRALRTTILDAEQRGLKVPPGLYAEYGYALLEEGKPTEAVPWFQKEKAKWPESAVLMDKMIRNAGQRPAAPAGTTGAASSVGGTP
jgi:hypothetical protein